jgi:hypothetical protein
LAVASVNFGSEKQATAEFQSAIDTERSAHLDSRLARTGHGISRRVASRSGSDQNSGGRILMATSRRRFSLEVDEERGVEMNHSLGTLARSRRRRITARSTAFSASAPNVCRLAISSRSDAVRVDRNFFDDLRERLSLAFSIREDQTAAARTAMTAMSRSGSISSRVGSSLSHSQAPAHRKATIGTRGAL